MTVDPHVEADPWRFEVRTTTPLFGRTQRRSDEWRQAYSGPSPNASASICMAAVVDSERTLALSPGI